MMKEDLKTILFVGLGALSETNDKMKEVGDGLYKKGKELYEKGVIANEELKRNINEAMKENVTVVNVSNNTSKDDILKNIEKLSEKDRKDLMKSLNKLGWNDVCNENGAGNKES